MFVCGILVLETNYTDLECRFCTAESSVKNTNFLMEYVMSNLAVNLVRVFSESEVIDLV